MFSCGNTGGQTEDIALIHTKILVCCLLQTSTSNPYSKGLPSKRYQVHQQRAPDLCGPTFQLITGYTPILDSRLQTSALVNDRDIDCARHIPDSGEFLIRHHNMFQIATKQAQPVNTSSGMAAYQGVVVASGVGIVTILLCVTNIHIFFSFGFESTLQ